MAASGRRLKRLKEEVQQGPADVIIGKHGVSDAVLAEIKRRLEDKGVVKVKALKSAVRVAGMDRRSLARYVAERLDAWLLDVRGRTFVLYKPGGGAAGGEAEKRRGRGNIRPRRLRGQGGEKKPWSRR